MPLIRQLTGIPLIDTHVHVFPPRFFQAIRRWFEQNAWKIRYSGSMEGLIQKLFDSGISGVVLLTYAHRPGISNQLNRFVGKLVRRFPSSAGMATFHPDDDEPLEVLRYAFEELGLCGVKIHCHVQRIAPDDPALFPVYEEIIRYNGVLNIHAGRGPVSNAYGIDVSSITGADRVENVLRRYPELKIIVPHLGYDQCDRFYSLLDRYPNLYLDTTMMMGRFFPVTIDRENIIAYSDRILYGSDYPHIPYGMEREAEAILDMDIGEEATRRILFENATRLFPGII